MDAPEDTNIAEVGYRTGSVFRVDVQRSRAAGLKIGKDNQPIAAQHASCRATSRIEHIITES
jgi:hypothetical protein